MAHKNIYKIMDKDDKIYIGMVNGRTKKDKYLSSVKNRAKKGELDLDYNTLKIETLEECRDCSLRDCKDKRWEYINGTEGVINKTSKSKISPKEQREKRDKAQIEKKENWWI